MATTTHRPWCEDQGGHDGPCRFYGASVAVDGTTMATVAEATADGVQVVMTVDGTDGRPVRLALDAAAALVFGKGVTRLAMAFVNGRSPRRSPALPVPAGRVPVSR